MADRRIPARRRGRPASNAASKGPDPRDFKARLAAASSITQATDDGYTEVERDDRLDYVDMPMILEKWEIRPANETYNSKVHCRVWAVVAVPDKPDPVFIKFRDQNDTMGEQLLEMERCRTFGNVAVVMDAREFTFNGGMDVGYEFSFKELNADGMADVPPPDAEPAASDEPPY